MKSDLFANIEKYITGWRHKQLWYKIVTFMASVVVFCTTYALILPAITMERDCQLPEHTHTEQCYTQVLVITSKTPICTVSSSGSHLHTADCLDADGNFVCGYESPIAHHHDEFCYTDDGELWCQLAEFEPHHHTASCYFVPDDENAEPELICGEHQHTDDCYEQTEELICDLPEGEPADDDIDEDIDDDFDEESDGDMAEEADEADCHRHDESCYQTVESLVCGWDSDHIHSDECYAQPEPESEPAEPQLICGEQETLAYTEHQHTDACFAIDVQPVDTEALNCTNPNHEHTALCYGVWQLTCGLQQHTHGEDCVTGAGDLADEDSPAGNTTATEPEQEQPEPEQPEPEQPTEQEQTEIAAAPVFAEPPTPAELEAAIDALPTAEDIATALAAFEEADDVEAMEAYYRQAYLAVMGVYVYWEEMPADQQAQVANAEKLCQLAELFNGYALEVTQQLKVYQVNKYSQALTTLVYGGSVQDKLDTTMGFDYWDAIIVEENANGQLYVENYITADGSKRAYEATTANGFVLLLYNTTASITKGEFVNVNFDYKTVSGYNSSGYGIVSFDTEASPKPIKDNTDDLTIVPGADTRDLIEVNLYDYGSNINDKYNSDNKYPGFQQDSGQQSVGSTASSNFGNNITTDLDAGKANLTNQGGAINVVTDTFEGKNLGSANIPVSGAMLSTLKDGYPALADGTSLAYLFSDNTYAKKQNSKSINGLFIYDDVTGAYTFNSRKNHAQFNSDDDTFTLYKQIITSNFMMYPFGNFLPFNDIVAQCTQASRIDKDYLQTIASSALYKSNNGQGSEYKTLSEVLTKFISLMGSGWSAKDCVNAYFTKAGIDHTFTNGELENIYSIDYDEPTDFYFGMEMKMNFMQPKDGKTGNDGQKPMVFYFTGDDDVWVYVDGKLFLDLSGIHRHVGGEIDFENGLVKYYALEVSTGDVSTEAYKTVTFSELLGENATTTLNNKGTFVDYSSHSFNFYYMERGAGSGVCRMNFNFPLLRQNSISVSKQLDDTTGILGNPDFQFQVLKENSKDLFIPAGTSYDIMDSAGNKIDTGTTDANGVFSIKAGQTAVFGGIKENAGKYFVRELLDKNTFAQYGKFTVDGSDVTQNYGVTVGEESFTGVNSPLKDVSDGSTVFTFTNHIDRDKLGSLSITKEIIDYPKSRDEKQFSFNVSLDGEPLPEGTTYTVGNDTQTVTTEGVITIAAGETATISNILAGSKFEVTETEKSAEGYTVSYKVDNNDPTSDKASGIIKNSSTVEVIVNNTETGASVVIPVSKVLLAPDGLEHTYTLQLQEVKSDGTEHESGYTQQLEITIPADNNEQAVSGKFTIGYATVDLTNLSQTFYYKISEPKDIQTEADSKTVFDTSYYIVEVTVSETDTGAVAEITNIKKYDADGTELEFTGDTAAFTNSIFRPELPSTGGCGTYMYTLAGTALVGAATYLLYKKRKREVRQTP